MDVQVVIKNPDGSTVDVDSLNVSDKMKDLLKVRGAGTVGALGMLRKFVDQYPGIRWCV